MRAHFCASRARLQRSRVRLLTTNAITLPSPTCRSAKPGASRTAGLLNHSRRNRSEDMEMKKNKKAAKSKSAKTPKASLTDILVNDKVRVVEVTMKPGSESDSMELPVRVTRALKGGTLTRTFPGGKSEKVKFKTGEVRF